MRPLEAAGALGQSPQQRLRLQVPQLSSRGGKCRAGKHLSLAAGCLFNICILDSDGRRVRLMRYRGVSVSLLGSELHSDLCCLKFGVALFLVGCQRLKLFKIDLRPQSELEEIRNPE